MENKLANKNYKFSLKHFFLLSVVLHFFITFIIYVSRIPTERAPLKETVSIELIDPDKIAKTETEKEILDRQIVQQDERSVNEEENNKAKFLSAKNQKINKETVAQDKGEFKNAKKAKPNALTVSQAQSPSKSLTKSEIQQQSEKPNSDKAARNSLLKELTRPYDAKSMFENNEKRREVQASPNTQNAANGTPGENSQTSDYLKGKDPGLETLLNTKEFKYYTYFNRIRKQLSQYWEPKVKEKLNKMFKQGRTIASTEEKVTKLLIILNNTGVLVKVQLVSDSGVRDLDDAAIEAFRAAAPFPNPPLGIADPDGTIKIRWDFVLES